MVIVIGVGGVSSGGKTQLCEKIAQRYPSVKVFNMDQYYIWPDVNMQLQYPLEYGFTYANFEVASAVNFDQLHRDLDEKLKEISNLPISHTCPVILVEGILIFAYRPLQTYFKKRYFLTLPKNVAEERRKQRSYNPPDPVNYFENYVWPYYEKHKESLADQMDVIYLDGNTDFKKNLERLSQDLDKLIAWETSGPCT